MIPEEITTCFSNLVPRLVEGAIDGWSCIGSDHGGYSVSSEYE